MPFESNSVFETLQGKHVVASMPQHSKSSFQEIVGLIDTCSVVPRLLEARVRKIFITLSFALSVLAMAGACTQVPDLDVATESVRIVDVVKRVKCDIYDAFTVDTPNGRRLLSQQKGYDWLNDWTAQVDLNLLVNH